MKILVADYIYTPDGFIQNQAVAFTETIQSIESRSVYRNHPIHRASGNTTKKISGCPSDTDRKKLCTLPRLYKHTCTFRVFS
jgi:hypothetical protein